MSDVELTAVRDAHKFDEADGGSYFALMPECERIMLMWERKECVWAQAKTLLHGKESIRAYSAFHAPATQMVFGGGKRKFVDLTLSFGGGRIECYNFHETATHAVGNRGHKPDCPLFHGVPLQMDDETLAADAFNMAYANHLTRHCDWLSITYSSETECDWHCRRDLMSMARNDHAFVTTPSWAHDRLDAAEVERMLLADDEEPNLKGFVVLRGGRESNDCAGGAKDFSGFLLQRSKRTVDELGEESLRIMMESMNLQRFTDETAKEFKKRREREARKELQRICDQEVTLMRRTFPADKDTCLFSEHFKFLVRTGRLTDYTIRMVVVGEYRSYLSAFVWKVLQARKDETTSRGRSQVLKLVLNSYYGYTLIDR